MPNGNPYHPMDAPGGSTWNGHYGDDETMRRMNYDRGGGPAMPLNSGVKPRPRPSPITVGSPAVGGPVLAGGTAVGEQ